MFKLLILVCAAGAPACTPETAFDVIGGPSVTMQQCLFGGQTQLAAARGLAPRPDRDVVRIVCRPVTDTTSSPSR